jgi:cytochrome c oxidase assembly protein subunit 15
MVVVGGVTRLTHSGLSIVEWAPVVGTIPPLTESEWQGTFDKYKQTPEYKQVNRGMSLDAFKGIFWWEYFHRLLGRLIGLVYLIPFLWFWWRGRIGRSLLFKLWGLFALGALQGAMGWYMVKSGLVDDPRVSHVRLTAHLGLAFLIFAAMSWLALDLLAPRRRVEAVNNTLARLARYAKILCVIIFLMVLSGGLVAGIRAGYAYNTFPLMNGHWIPPEIMMMEPWYLNFTNNMALVQFNHRLIAWFLAFAIPALWWCCRRADIGARTGVAANLLLLALSAQIALGISTLLLRVPVALGAAHQGGAVVVFGLAIWLAHRLTVDSQTRA